MKVDNIFRTYIIVIMLGGFFALTSCFAQEDPSLNDIPKFFMAIKDGDIRKVKYYLTHFNGMANVRYADRPIPLGGLSLSPIITAARFNHESMEILDLLLENGGDLNYVDEKGFGALHYASIHNNVLAISYLLKKGMDVNSVDNMGGTCLLATVSLNNFEAARILLENGAKISILTTDFYHSVYTLSPLTMDSNTLLKFLNLFIQYDSSFLDVPTKDGFTSFLLAVIARHYETIDFYLEHGASVTKVLNNMHPDLEFLFLPENQEYLIKLLQNANEPLNGTNTDGYTLLMRSIFYYPSLGYELIKKIAELSEDINTEIPDGLTAFMSAVALNHPDVAKLLLNMGADKNHTDIDGNTALWYYKQFQQNELVNPEILDLFE
jgi:serine/threonine-protein phosphatase 6 regulatory ankyrin repeat subunit B